MVVRISVEEILEMKTLLKMSIGFTVLGAIALKAYKETIQQVINLPLELSVMSLIY